MRTFNLIIIVCLLLLPSVSSAFGGYSFERGMFWGADLNRNNCLDRDEAKAIHNLAEKEIFDRFDQDGNGCISFTEFHDFMQKKPWIGFVHPSER